MCLCFAWLVSAFHPEFAVTVENDRERMALGARPTASAFEIAVLDFCLASHASDARFVEKS
jgi:hypothetical protein